MTGIIYYGAGNLFSLQCSLERIGEKYTVITQADEFDNCDRYIIPGVGHAGAAMEKLNNSGLIPLIQSTQKPVLGICLGMQLLTGFSEEGNSTLTDIIHLKTVRFNKTNGVKIPHTGWNMATIEKDNPLYQTIPDKSYFYFVHSYFIEFSRDYTLSSTEYGDKFSSAINRDNFFGVQFHPEKSGQAGEILLKNFVQLK